ncbi:unnamed protein product [Linum tenue]|uniref:BSD domain-containing protein n=1 Tax=Linum tenue TaxID=586396 RepID=A0AAV0I776_9ROSI|nr:unnamed protein product [Linum tenue]
MSWLARSLADSLRLDDDNTGSENDAAADASSDGSLSKRNDEGAERLKEIGDGERGEGGGEEEEEEDALARGVREDLSELGQTLQRQLWGVAAFLAPPPTTSASNLNDSDPSDRPDGATTGNSEETSGIRQEFAEIGGRFRSGVTEISKGDRLETQVEEEEEEGGEEYYYEEADGEDLETEEYDDDWAAKVVGITDEVLAFARNIAMHPETWLDFPLDEEEDLDDLQMSDAQQLHTSVIEQLAPRLAALRIELCPCHMTDSYFWKVYFVLLHSRLNKHDAEVLSTRQVMEARSLWMQELHKQTKPECDDWFGKSSSYVRQSSDLTQEAFFTPRTYDEHTSGMSADFETEKHLVSRNELPFIDKSVIAEKPVVKNEHKDIVLLGSSSKVPMPIYEEEEDEWPDAEDSDYDDCKTPIVPGDEEDISFSDFEDDCIDLPLKDRTKKVVHIEAHNASAGLALSKQDSRQW